MVDRRVPLKSFETAVLAKSSLSGQMGGKDSSSEASAVHGATRTQGTGFAFGPNFCPVFVVVGIAVGRLILHRRGG